MPSFPFAVHSPHPKGGHLILMPDFSQGEGRPGFFAWVRLHKDTLFINFGPPRLHQALRKADISDLTIGHMVAQFVTSSGLFGLIDFRENMILRSGAGALPSSPEWIRLRDAAGCVDVMVHMTKPFIIAPSTPSHGKDFLWLDEKCSAEDIALLAECLKSMPRLEDA
jgi:hypothetical protein